MLVDLQNISKRLGDFCLKDISMGFTLRWEQLEQWSV